MTPIRKTRLLPYLVTCLMLAGCDPAFKSTAEQCAAFQDSAVVVAVDNSDPNVSPYTIPAGADSSSYLLYLQDILEAAQPGPTETLTTEQQDALNTIINKLDTDYDLGYDLVTGQVTQAANPLDYLEELISTVDPSRIVEAFRAAKQQIADGIAANDGFCDYRNRNITIVDQDAIPLFFAELSLSYSPFTSLVQQSILITELKDDLVSSTQRATAPYIGFYQANPATFSTSGYTLPILRQALSNTTDQSENLTVDDGYDLKLGQIILATQDTYCHEEVTDGDGVTTREDCANTVTTRDPVKDQCNGSEPEGENETNKVELRSFDLNASLTGLKRIRLEADYVSEEVRIYVSEYNSAIFDADGTSPIHDPTDCEIQAVLDELADLTPGVGVSVTGISDPGFDVTYVEEEELDANGDIVLDANGNPVMVRAQDDDGNDIEIDPTPAITYTGVALPDRK